MSIEEVEKKLSVSVNAVKPTQSKGLSDSEAAALLEKYGPNQLSPPLKRPLWLQFLDYLLGLFNVMLLVAGIACYITYGIDPVNNASNSYLGGIVIGVAFMNASIEFYQVRKSQAMLESFLNMIPVKCYVIRSGKLLQIEAHDLVLGDIVYIKSGDKIPADLRIFWANELKVDNSSLTGEAEPQERVAKNSHENPLEATNLVFNATLAVNGDAYGVVIRTGDDTVIGQIATLTTNEERRASPLSEEIHLFVAIIAVVAGIVTVIFMIVAAAAKGQGVSGTINIAIGTFVSFVPEGLPATVTMLLTIAAKRMAERNVLVKDLQGVETLGAITMLATDKTGTLTRNQMTVTYIWTGNSLYYAQSQSATESQHAAPLDVTHKGVNEILLMSALCSRARFESNEGPISERPILGDATEAGLLRNAAIKLAQFDEVRDIFPKEFEIPFNSENKWAMTIHKRKHDNGHLMLYLKGAPERVLQICSTFFDGEKPIPLGDAQKKAFNDTYTFMASKGHRVLAFAGLALPGNAYPENFVFTKDPINYPRSDLTFYGLVSLEDPPKHGVREAVGHCRAAGIKVMMVTGDHPLTAEAIGRKINMMLQDTKELIAAKRNLPVNQVNDSEVHAIVIHGEKIDSLTDAEWDNIFSKEEIIFARTSPKHKLQIVKRAQAQGHIVGVTGDGVNDSPALKKADLGIAMNISGSDVSKEAAAMILIDDNFASTVNGIEEGRLIFQNLKKSIQYTVTHTMPEVYANLLWIAVPIPLPLNPILLLLCDLGFELFLALSYAWDPPENRSGLMKLPPRKPVTPESIARLRLQQAEDKEYDAKPGTKLPFLLTSRFWKRKFEASEEDILVDKNLLLWSYVEAGTIESIGCLVAFFVSLYYHYGITPYDCVKNGSTWGTGSSITLANGTTLTNDDQFWALSLGQSAYYLTIMIQQCFNLFICKARYGIPVGSFMFANKYTFVSIGIGASISFLMVYIPPFNVALQSNFHLSPLIWLIAVGFGVVLFGYSVGRSIIISGLNPVKYSKDLPGLNMAPTRWSTGR